MAMVLNKSAFEASEYQQAIFERVAAYDTDIVVSAVAGSGKSTTLKQLLDYIPAHMSVLYLAFNNDAAASLGKKLDNYAQEKKANGERVCTYTSSTIHSFGNATLRSFGISNKARANKYGELCKEYLLNNLDNFKPTLISQFAKLVDMVRLTLSNTDEESLIALMDRFEIDIPTVCFSDDEDNEEDEIVETPEWTAIKNGVDTVLRQGIRLAKSAREYDFTDMIWLPSSKAMNLAPKQYDWVLCDEAQDLSPAQRELVLRARKAGGHFIAVGDRRQAIYGFCGASLQSIDEIIGAIKSEKSSNVVEMPLSICYRCPSSVIDLANTVWTGTEARPNAPEGIVERIGKEQVQGLVQAGDLILCRLTAPLVEKCLELLRTGIRANVRGKDLGSQFTTLIENIKKASRFSDERLFLDLVNVAHEYERHQIAILSRNLSENEMKIDSLKDKIATLIALYEAYLDKSNGSSSFTGFQDYIKAFFADDPNAQIILSTGHRAKGLEYKRVFILQSDRLPHPKAKTADAITQEYNLMYVMYTRAMEALYLVQETAPIPVIIEEEVTLDVEAPVVIAETVVEPVTVTQEVVTTQPIEKPAYPAVVHFTKQKKGKLTGVAYNFPPEVAEKLTVAADLILSKHGKKLDKSAYVAGRIMGQYLPLDELIASLQDQDNPPDPDNGGGDPKPETSKQTEEAQPDRQFGEALASFFDMAIQDAAQRGYTVQAVVSTPQEPMPVVAPVSGVQQAMPFDDAVDEEQVVRRFYICGSKFCTVKRWGYDYHRDPHTRELYRLDASSTCVTAEQDAAKCPFCNNPGKFIKVRQLKATYHAGTRCTGSCQNATSDECNCSCGGEKHGKRKMKGAILLKSAKKA